MTLAASAGKAMDKVHLRLRHPKAFEVTTGQPGPFDALRGRKYALLVSFRRDGRAVPTPIWFGLDEEGRVYTHTFAEAGKVKRLRNDPLALLAPCTVRGKPLGPAVEGRAKILPEAQWVAAERAIQTNYGLGRRIYTAPAWSDKEAMTYLEIAPLAPEGAPVIAPLGD